jgi:pyruvate dehydrogenase E1 component alpha subunit
MAFIGDGASNQGTVAESLNFSAVLKLPMIFMYENNGYAETVASSHFVSGTYPERAAGFGMPGVSVDGHDFFAVHEAVGEAVRRARAGLGPTLIECTVGRYYGHQEGDTQTYRPKGEGKQLRKTRDCLARFAERVTADGLLTSEDLAAIDAEVADLIDEAVDQARKAPDPEPGELYTDVYISY